MKSKLHENNKKWYENLPWYKKIKMKYILYKMCKDYEKAFRKHFYSNKLKIKHAEFDIEVPEYGEINYKDICF